MGTLVSDNPTAAATREASDTGPAIALYDGRCGLCNRLLRFATKRARPGKLQFLSLQSERGRKLQIEHGFNPQDLNSMILIESGKAFTRSDASLRLLNHLRLPWPMVGVLLMVPRPIRNAVYDWIARHRARWFGTCELPANGQNEEQ